MFNCEYVKPFTVIELICGVFVCKNEKSQDTIFFQIKDVLIYLKL